MTDTTKYTAETFAVLLQVGGSVHDRTVLIDSLAVRVWWSLEADLSAAGRRAAGWKWSINGEGPDVWYANVATLFEYLAEHWDAIVAEQAGITPEADLRAKLRAAEARIDALLTQVAEQQRKADAVYRIRQVDATRLIEERRALTAEANDLRRQRDAYAAKLRAVRSAIDGIRPEDAYPA